MHGRHVRRRARGDVRGEQRVCVGVVCGGGLRWRRERYGMCVFGHRLCERVVREWRMRGRRAWPGQCVQRRAGVRERQMQGRCLRGRARRLAVRGAWCVRDGAMRGRDMRRRGQRQLVRVCGAMRERRVRSGRMPWRR